MILVITRMKVLSEGEKRMELSHRMIVLHRRIDEGDYGRKIDA